MSRKKAQALLTGLLSVLVGLGLLSGSPARAAADFYLYTSDSSFSPNGDGNEDSYPIQFNLYEAANLTVTIDRVDSQVRTITADESRSAGSVYPVGRRDDSGAIVDDGDYRVTITADNANGVPAMRTVIATVDTRTPGTLTTPSPAGTLSGLVDLAITLTAGINVTSASWSLPGCSWSQNTADLDGLFRVTGADTADAPPVNNDVVVAELTDTHGRGHSYSDSITVTVTDTTAPTVQVYNPSYYQQQTITRTNPTTLSTIWMPFTCIDGSAVTWDFALTNSRGDTVRTWTPDQAHTSNRCNNYYYDAYLYLDGTDPDGNLCPTATTLTATTTDTGGLTGNATATITIDTRTPGTLTTPSPAGDSSGLVDLAITPTAGINVTSASWSLPGCSWSQNTADPDGLFRVTGADTGYCTAGEQTMWWSLN